jgi:hypothetical protein
MDVELNHLDGTEHYLTSQQSAVGSIQGIVSTHFTQLRMKEKKLRTDNIAAQLLCRIALE